MDTDDTKCLASQAFSYQASFFFFYSSFLFFTFLSMKMTKEGETAQLANEGCEHENLKAIVNEDPRETVMLRIREPC